jgi:hypothetical protein
MSLILRLRLYIWALVRPRPLTVPSLPGGAIYMSPLRRY